MPKPNLQFIICDNKLDNKKMDYYKWIYFWDVFKLVFLQRSIHELMANTPRITYIYIHVYSNVKTLKQNTHLVISDTNTINSRKLEYWYLEYKNSPLNDAQLNWF